MEQVYHYTTGHFIGQIVQSGYLALSSRDIGPNERPVLWFSSRRDLEPTMCDPQVTYTVQGVPHIYRPYFTPEEFRACGMGLYRFAYPMSKLQPYRRLLKSAKIGLTRRKVLERVARNIAASPSDWFGSLESIALSDHDLVPQYYNGKYWVTVEQKDLLAGVVMEQTEIGGELFGALVERERAKGVREPVKGVDINH